MICEELNRAGEVFLDASQDLVIFEATLNAVPLFRHLNDHLLHLFLERILYSLWTDKMGGGGGVVPLRGSLSLVALLHLRTESPPYQHITVAYHIYHEKRHQMLYD